jgi:hypothetical protein
MPGPQENINSTAEYGYVNGDATAGAGRWFIHISQVAVSSHDQNHLQMQIKSGRVGGLPDRFMQG